MFGSILPVLRVLLLSVSVACAVSVVVAIAIFDTPFFIFATLLCVPILFL